jgi:tetratricopeptide (TPR) repeat protein
LEARFDDLSTTQAGSYPHTDLTSLLSRSLGAAIALKPDYAEAFCNRGNVLAELKRLDEALASFDRAIALKPRYARALANRGTMLQQLDRSEEARGNLESAIAFEPHFAEAHYNLANILR